MSRVSLDLLDAFAAVARTGNLTRAAEAMHVTVSALSHRMRLLEERLGARVFARGPRGVSLTVAGRRLFDAIGGPLAGIDRALRDFRCSCDDSLTLSTVPLMANGWLVPLLPDFVARHPQVRLNLQSDTRVVDFEREPVDAALRLGSGGWSGVHAEHLFDEWVSPVASPTLLKRIGGPRRTALARAPLLGDPADRWTAWFALHGGKAPEHFVAGFDDSEALHHAAVQGLGVALGREVLARPLIEAGRLVALSRRRMQAGFGYYLVYPSRSREHRGFLAFRTWLYAQIGQPLPPL
ncbi:MAG TPA: LysR substrate-binding domain-containing protein [Rhodanobacteraceae bacterium]|nr:LysR substrate-binding domain-containing protein [Rhodanobacteraceae bacterium]